MREAGTVLDVLRERERRGLPLERLYRQLLNPQLYLLAYGRLYSNKGAMTPGPDGETVDGMSWGKIERIIDALRHERFRFKPVLRTYIPKKNGKKRPLELPSWSDKLVGEVIRLLPEAYYEPQFSDLSHGFRPHRGCHTALSEVTTRWTGTHGSSKLTSPTAWMHHHTAPLLIVGVSNRASSGVETSIRRPFRRPVRVRAARSSPCLTLCKTVWRETCPPAPSSTAGTAR